MTARLLDLSVEDEWINRFMENQPKNNDLETSRQGDTVASRPNESGQLYIDDFLRISDPNTQEVILEKRS